MPYKSNHYTYLNNDTILQATIANPLNTNFECLNSPPCDPTLTGSSGSFGLYDIGNNLVVANTEFESTEGFDRAGARCSTFDNLNGNNACPLQLNLSWEVMCSASCSPPDLVMKIMGRFSFKPASDKNGVVNLTKYDFSLLRDFKGPAEDTFGPVNGSTHSNAIATGREFACAIVNGGVKCWGENSFGQLGNGTNVNNLTPEYVSGLGSGSGISDVAAGKNHACVVVDGGVKCWGKGDFGQLGDGFTENRNVPIDVVGLGSGSGVQRVAAGRWNTCAIVNGGAKCWGRNTPIPNETSTTEVNPAFGDFDNWTRGGGFLPYPKNLVPVDVNTLGPGSGVTDISISKGGFWDAGRHTCVVANGGVKCWGSKVFGRLGNGTDVAPNIPVPSGSSEQITPVDVTGLGPNSGAEMVAVGGTHSCALVDGGVKCWGFDYYQQLGNGAEFSLPSYWEMRFAEPVDVTGLGPGSNVTKVYAGNSHTCAVVNDGVRCWGDNNWGGGRGILGTGDFTDRFPDPTPVLLIGAPASGIAYMDVNTMHSCVLLTSGGGKCWGQMLDTLTTTDDFHTPVDIPF